MPKIITNPQTNSFIGKISDLVLNAQKQDMEGLVHLESESGGLLEFNEVRDGKRDNGVLIGNYTGPETEENEIDFALEEQEDRSREIQLPYPKMDSGTRKEVLEFIDKLLGYAASMELGDGSYEATLDEIDGTPETYIPLEDFDEHWKQKMLKSLPKI